MLQERHSAVLRRVWGAAARLQADAGAGHVHVRERLHGKGAAAAAPPNNHVSCGRARATLGLAVGSFWLLQQSTPCALLDGWMAGWWGSQVAGTEMGVKEPEATFSACFGSAFIMFHPMK